MADVTITASSVLHGSGANLEDGLSGEAITAGQAVYWKTSTRTWFKAKNSGTAAESGYATGSKVGVAVNSAPGVGQYVKVLRDGNLTAGGTLVVGTAYVIGDAYGGIAPATDLGSSDYVTVLGVATTAAILKMAPIISGVEVP
jgi:hypothetical protein